MAFILKKRAAGGAPGSCDFIGTYGFLLVVLATFLIITLLCIFSLRKIAKCKKCVETDDEDDYAEDTESGHETCNFMHYDIIPSQIEDHGPHDGYDQIKSSDESIKTPLREKSSKKSKKYLSSKTKRTNYSERATNIEDFKMMK